MKTSLIIFLLSLQAFAINPNECKKDFLCSSIGDIKSREACTSKKLACLNLDFEHEYQRWSKKPPSKSQLGVIIRDLKERIKSHKYRIDYNQKMLEILETRYKKVQEFNKKNK